MKVARLMGLAVLLTGVFFTVFAEDGNEAQKWARVKKPLPNIYVKLDPKSEIIRQGKRGEYLEIIAEGESGTWLKVRVDGKDGWLQASTADIVVKKGNPAVIMFVTVIVLMLGCAVCIVLFIKKQQAATAAAASSE